MMISHLRRVPFVALIPILVAFSVFSIYILGTKMYVYCDWGNCESITHNLFKALPLEKADAHIIQSTDSPEVAHEKLYAQYQYNSLRFSGRITWMLLESTYLIFCGIGFLIAARIIEEHIATSRHKSLILIGITIFVIAFGIYLYQNQETYSPILIELAKSTIEQDASNFRQALNTVNAIGFPVIALLFLAVTTILLPATNTNATDNKKSILHKTEQLQTILYAGTLILVTAILIFQSIFHWAKAFLIQEAAMLSVAEFTTNSLITLWAIQFSALLAAAYLPAYIILRSRALTIAELDDKPTGSHEWLKESGLDLNFSQMMSRLLTIIAPLLASPIINILSQFVQ